MKILTIIEVKMSFHIKRLHKSPGCVDYSTQNDEQNSHT